MSRLPRLLLLLLLLSSTFSHPLVRQGPAPVQPVTPEQPASPTPSPTPTIPPSTIPSPSPSTSSSPAPPNQVQVPLPSPLPSPLSSPSAIPSATPPSETPEVLPSPGVGGISFTGRNPRVANGLTAGLIGALFVLLAFIIFAVYVNRTRNQPSEQTSTNITPPVQTPLPPPPGEYSPQNTPPPNPPVDPQMPLPPPVPRGPTPPPHDYVLGAGPAASREDFVALRDRFERDEIGDNSAVLGLAKGDGEGLPDRPAVEGVTFESQERLIAGGDGSGAVSDAVRSVGGGSIKEEGGDVPSLERDPMDRKF